MSNNEPRPVDPFDDIDLSDFSNPKKTSPKKPVADVTLIKKMAEQENFQSRQAPKKKEKIIPKTFSLFPSELDIVNSTLNSVMAYTDIDDPYTQVRPSGSDVVRAALHSFGQLSEEERINLVQEYRGRGRK
tara:strand:- start:4207 stop:4599 length:393 start_codon:yes stop_codon:yes gene_type:complete